MKNFDMYKTVDELANAFFAHCKNTNCEECEVRDKLNGGYGEFGCVFGWLNLEYKANPLPCPFCGMELMTVSQDDVTDGYYVGCGSCQYRSPSYPTEHDVIVEHNSVARAVMEKNEKEKHDDK